MPGGSDSLRKKNTTGEHKPWKQDNSWAVEIPNALSLLPNHTLTGQVKGLREFPPDEQPPVAVPYYSFRVMVAIGFGLVLLMLWTLWSRHRGESGGKSGFSAENAVAGR